MTPRIVTVALLFAATAIFLPNGVSAQSRNNTSGANSLFGGGGSSFSGGGTTGGSAGGLGGSRLGGGAAGGQALGFGAQGAGAQGGFVGRSEADVTNFFNQLNPLGAQLGNLGGQNRGALNRGRDANSTQDVRPPLKVKVRVAFEAPAAPAFALMPVAQNRLNGILQTHGMPHARVSLQDGVAVISGRVDSARDAKLVARLARLEPGVVRVVDRTESEDTLPAPPAPAP